MTHATHYMQPRFTIVWAALLVTGGVALAGAPSRDEVLAAQRVCRQLSADVLLANARLKPESLEYSRQLGELEFVLTALDEEIQFHEDQHNRLERSEHPDAAQAVQQVKVRLEELVQHRNTLRARHKDLLAAHMRLVLEDGDPLSVDQREAWRHALDEALQSLSRSVPAVAEPTAKEQQGQSAQRVPPKQSEQEHRRIHPRCLRPRR